MHSHPYFQLGFSPLLAASQCGHQKTVDLLLRAGANVDLANKVRTCVGQFAYLTFHIQDVNLYNTYVVLFTPKLLEKNKIRVSIYNDKNWLFTWTVQKAIT